MGDCYARLADTKSSLSIRLRRASSHRGYPENKLHHSRILSRKITLRAVLAIAVLLAVLALLFMLEQRRTQAEMGAVLSAYLSAEVLNNTHDWGSGRGVQMVVQREAQGPGNWRWRWIMLSDRRSWFPGSSRTSRFSFFLTNVLVTDIQADLHLPSGVTPVFVSRKELERFGRNEFQTRFPNNFGYIAVSHIGLNLTKSEAVFYIDHFCGLCGGGGYVLMRKANGQWRVADQHSTWVS